MFGIIRFRYFDGKKESEKGLGAIPPRELTGSTLKEKER